MLVCSFSLDAAGLVAAFALLLWMRSRVYSDATLAKSPLVSFTTGALGSSGSFVPPRPRSHRWASASEPHWQWWLSLLDNAGLSESSVRVLTNIGLTQFLLTACLYRDLSAVVEHYELTIEAYFALLELVVRRRLQHHFLAEQRDTITQLLASYPPPSLNPWDREDLRRA